MGVKRIQLNTSNRAVPMIYAYTTPEIARHNGWTKIGYTEQDVKTRIEQQTATADVVYHEEWRGSAVFDDGTGEVFSDKDFHRYLRKNDVEQEAGKNNEWFHINGPDSRAMFYDFRSNRGLQFDNTAGAYDLREEQERCVAETQNYCETHDTKEFLWNAKPRFGKSLSAYDFCKRIDAQNVLIITNRPAIANSWYEDYVKFVGANSGYVFVSTTDALKGKKYVHTREEYLNILIDTPLGNIDYRCIEFVSLQDLKGSIHFGGQFDKLSEIKDINWDVLIIDEAHEGVDTYRTDTALTRIKRKITLHLSGTPFKAIANDKFEEKAIFNWTYADEQEKKRKWEEDHPGETNPYANLPRLNLFTYQMSEIIRDELERGIEIKGETEEYAFDLNEFFRTDGAGRFVYNSAVDKFLDALTTQEKFPFSTQELRDEIKHSFWMLNRVDSARALARKLEKHDIFSKYEIILAAGDGKLDDEDASEKSFNKVVEAIKTHDKTITLSVGQLTTGVTIPEWTAVLMLSNLKSPSLYMQAAFRAQNPCLFYNSDTKEYRRKENAYVFDFDPARTLVIFEEFANDLCSSTSSGKGDINERKKHIRELLNFFPVYGEDDEGEMIPLDAEKVLSIPRKIKSEEVVRRGFMSNYLFQNISAVFGAPQIAVDIIKKFDATKEPTGTKVVDPGTKEELHIDEDGNVNIPEETVIGISGDLFGEKIYGLADDMANEIEQAREATSSGSAKAEKEAMEQLREKFKDSFKENVTDRLIDVVKESYGEDLKKSDERQIQREIDRQVETTTRKVFAERDIDIKEIEKERNAELKAACANEDRRNDINEKFDRELKKREEKFADDLKQVHNDLVEQAKKTAARTAETNKSERAKKEIEDVIRDHLRGFSRTIPSFLMAYGDDTITLATFDTKVPEKVFIEVTSISLDEFRFLRDGGDYTDEETHEVKHFEGKLFDAIVFDDSVKEFLRLKKKLANYFDEAAIEDIFDYIPPQKTNQIYTPKDVVKHMADLLEQENPGCFDDPYKTFIDLYMKSGLYITEIVKRLFNSPKLKAEFPNDQERLQWIFESQVYGLAPTEIIYKIATNYILGFSEDIPIRTHNFKCADATEAAKENRLSEFLDELYGDNAPKE